MAGSFVWTLVLTDIASGWTECVPLLVRGAGVVVDAVDRLRGALPFPLRGIDTDNGSEFLNEVLMGFCHEHGIELTRSRPYRKNDQAWESGPVRTADAERAIAAISQKDPTDSR